jgi:F0F1-type ATP synthase assembly protein I
MSAPKLSPDVALLMGMGVSVAVWLTVGVLAGRWTDRAWDWAPWGTLIGSLVGISGAAVNIYQIIRRMERREKQNRE